MNLKLQWDTKSFDALSNQELYELLRLRNEVFIVEQNCIFPDLDGKDQKCYHLRGMENGNLMAYSRIVPPGISYEYPSIGRILVSPLGRGKMFGIELMEQSITKLEEIYGEAIIRIGAQLYLKRFYESFGFVQSGEIYDEDGIDHIEMTRKNTFVE
ncbi:GNAT family N-acetyltransferase [Dyadobacter frigoris]|uniref:GNAT family N-acetyltransferase n=1 Tax=Dyadobacter frigoris TaxID=2576211 RepID=A0A4U6D6X8_9BACT|nr:GNAT family N-acetyltransferase [Dyadobacter frigoris]TKT93122.1 GNAT family N-acetyltransferase [Dyadobacter frigoris]GLU55997.1 ElaA protein [Dyadobacter frigoris]